RRAPRRARRRDRGRVRRGRRPHADPGVAREEPGRTARPRGRGREGARGSSRSRRPAAGVAVNERYRRTLELLSRHGVDFVVVGGVAAVLQGVPLVTFDVDVVHGRTDENVDRLLAALAELDARYRGDPRGLVPTRETLLGPGQHLLSTALGPLDL